jgi:hypothetical protein
LSVASAASELSQTVTFGSMALTALKPERNCIVTMMQRKRPERV